jgi:hypothetical protein
MKKQFNFHLSYEEKELRKKALDGSKMKGVDYDLTVRDFLELNRSMIVNVFDEELYRDYVLKMARDIQKKKGFVRRLLDKIDL